MKWLERSQKDIFDYLKKEENKDNFNKDFFKTFEARNGEKGLFIEKEDKVSRLNSSYCPTEEAKRWVKQYKSDNINQMIFMYGLGNGIFARELYQQMEDDGKLCIYEPDIGLFYFVLKNFDLTGLLSSEKVRFIIEGINAQYFYNLLVNTIDYYNLKSIVICTHPQYDLLYPEKYSYFNEKLKNAIVEIKTNRNTEEYFGKWAVENILYNISFLNNAMTLNDLVEARNWEEDTAIIVAAGPSLDKNIRELKKAVGKAVIIATDTAIRYLVKENIRPDFIVTVDARKPVHYFSEYPEFLQIPLFCSERSNYEITKLHTGRKIWFNCSRYLKGIYERYNKKISEYGAGGSVATAAFSICVELGIKHIILVGQDLAYEGNRTHAGTLESHIFCEEDTIKTVEGIDGKPIKTRADWDSYRSWFEESIIWKPEILVIDATEGGAKIKGAKIEKLSKAIEKYCKKEFDSKEMMKRLPVSLNEKQLKDAKEYIVGQKEELSEIEKKIQEVIENCDRVLSLMKKNPYANIENYSKKIIKNNEKIIQYDILQLILDYTCEEANKELVDICRMSEDEKENIKKTYKITKITYEKMLKGISPVKEMLEAAIQRLN